MDICEGTTGHGWILQGIDPFTFFSLAVRSLTTYISSLARTTNCRLYSNNSQIWLLHKTWGYYNEFESMKSLPVCCWYVKMPQCGCVEHGLAYITFYVQKHIAHLVALFWFPADSRPAARGDRICENPLLASNASDDDIGTVWWSESSICEPPPYTALIMLWWCPYVNSLCNNSRIFYKIASFLDTMYIGIYLQPLSKTSIAIH